MTYAAEPYAQFVDDLLTALTGGEIREQFRFLFELAPFKLTAPGAVVPNTVRVFGLADGSYRRFRQKTDYVFSGDGGIQWQAQQNDRTLPAKDAVWPDEGSTFYVNYEALGGDPPLTDRNPGSITRLLAESFAREYAVVSRQIEGVYKAGFVATAGGRDLEQIAALVGITRRRRLSATGSALFNRTSPAPADIFVPAGTKLSTSDAPAQVFETTEDRTLRRGNLSVEAPISALVPGADGVVAANAVRTINRPILGIDEVGNPQATRFAGADETDDTLRARVRRALEVAGRASTGALVGALTTLPGLREKDIRIAEDYIAHPGVVKLSVALPEMSDAEAANARQLAVELIEATRPAGVRIEHNIDAPRPPGPATPGGGTVAESALPMNADPVPALPSAPNDLFVYVDVEAVLTPATLSLSADERNTLMRLGEQTVSAFIEDAGIGETLVYNRLVGRLMQLDGVLDVALEMRARSDPDGSGRRNLMPENPNARPAEGQVIVTIGGALVMLDISVGIKLKGAALAPGADSSALKMAALGDVQSKLEAFLKTAGAVRLTPNLFKGPTGSETYEVGDLHYFVEYVDAGVRVHQQDAALQVTDLDRLWIRKLTLIDGGAP